MEYNIPDIWITYVGYNIPDIWITYVGYNISDRRHLQRALPLGESDCNAGLSFEKMPIPGILSMYRLVTHISGIYLP